MPSEKLPKSHEMQEINIYAQGAHFNRYNMHNVRLSRNQGICRQISNNYFNPSMLNEEPA